MKMLLLFVFLGLSAPAFSKSIYDFQVEDIDGKSVKLDSFKGEVLMVVNTASQCGFTSQYAQLQKMHERFKDKGFAVLGFPSDNFGGQEFDSNEKIKVFCEENYQVNFPLFSKIDVRGEKQHPLFAWLTDQAGGRILWNFEKFIVDRKGNVLDRFRSITSPDDEDIVSLIEKNLKAK